MSKNVQETDARQARKGFGVRNILFISMALAVVALAVVWLTAA